MVNFSKNQITTIMKQLVILFLSSVLFVACNSGNGNYTVEISEDFEGNIYPVEILTEKLNKLGLKKVEAKSVFKVVISKEATFTKESFEIEKQDKGLLIKSSDIAGAIYAVHEIIEQVRSGKSLSEIESTKQQPFSEFRAVKFNLPWFAYRTNEAITIHTETCKDLKYWESFLNMMAENRLNALTLWNLHPFEYMIKLEDFPYANQFTDEEFAEWQDLFRGIFAMAKERGIETYVVNWNIFVSEGFKKHHNLPRHGNIHIHSKWGGVDKEIHDLAKEYNKQCAREVINQYPNLTGIGFSLGEAMGGMTAEQRQQWMLDTYVAGMQEANRKAKLIHRVPFSAGLKNGGSTSVTTEQITRKALESIEGVQYPIWLEAKFNWSHAHSSTKLIKVHGGALKDTYWNPPSDKFKMCWMARNEDFFMLRWGEPDFIREHIQQNLKDYIGGYYIGSECYIPALDYITKKQGYKWEYAYERQWMFYKTWGRLLYNPEVSNSIFEDDFTARYAKDGNDIYRASVLASKFPLIYASYIDVNNDKSLYSEGILARYKKDSSEFLNVNLMLAKATLDPDLISAKEYVDAIINNKQLANHRITPLHLADSLDNISEEALSFIANVVPGENIAKQYELADIKIWCALSRYFADKLRGVVVLQEFRITANKTKQKESVKYLEEALKHWDEIIKISEPYYNPVPLTHLHHRQPDNNKFHWSVFRSKVVEDIKIAKEDIRAYGN